MNKIIKLLHHRKPYLLIDDIVDLRSDYVETIKIPTLDEFYLQGHFPGAPVVPGAILQEMTTQTAGLLIAEFYSPVPDYDSEKTKGYALGVLRAVHYSKFKSFARNDDKLSVRVHLIEHENNQFHFKASIFRDESKIMSNSFTLINIEEQLLKGV